METPKPPSFDSVDTLLTGFNIATMCRPGVVLAAATDGTPVFRCPDTHYGALENVSVAMGEGKICWILPTKETPVVPDHVSQVSAQSFGPSCWLTPGLIDCHTHLVYGGNRSTEWEARLGGTSYEDIARSGGGILTTVAATRRDTEEQLLRQALPRLQRLMAEGVTTVEIKSGYGLDLESELKMLRVAQQFGRELPINVEPTLLGAHCLPPEYAGRSDAYLDLVCQEMIPASVGLATAVDAFCETIAFDVNQTTRVLQAAKEAGLAIKVHAEQLSNQGMAVVAAKLGALSADHLEYLTDDDVAQMALSETVATLLPGAFYCLQETQVPPVQSLLEHQVPVAIATDCNPGSSPLVSLLTAGHLACTLFGMPPEQALLGMTRHAAQALGRSGTIGTLEPGAQADLAVWNVESPGEILYLLGGNPCVGRFYQGVQT